MAKMLTEEEVARMEKQRELRDRARAAGSTAGMSWIEKERFNQQQLNDRFRQAHEEGMERKRLSVLANPGAEANTNYRHSVMRDAEMRAAQAHEMDRLGKELATRETEAHEKRFGMREQGRDAAEFNKDAAIRTAELQTASNEKIAGINKDSAQGVAKINAESNERINTDKNKTVEEVAQIEKEGKTESAQVQAQAQARKEYAEGLMRQRDVGEKQAWDFAQKRMAMINERAKTLWGKRIGTPTPEIFAQAEKMVDETLKGSLPGKPRKFQF